MRIVSVTVKNFRMHEDLAVTFGPSRTLVVGPNESGKSTLVDAIERVLFHPHRSTARLEGIKPKAGGGPPEVAIVFERNGRTHTLHKVFKGAQATATLTDDAGGSRSGDDAEAEVRKLLEVGEGRINQPLQGWSHLWARQGQAGVDPTTDDSLDTAAAQLDQRLKSIAGTTLTESDADTRTYDGIDAACRETFNNNGTVRAQSPLGRATVELASAREAATAAASRLAEFEEAADAVVREQEAIRSHRETLSEAERQLEETRRTLARIEGLEKAVERERGELTTADREYAELRDGDAEIAASAEALEQLRKSLGPKEEEIAGLRGHERRTQSASLQAATAMRSAIGSQQSGTTLWDLLKALETRLNREAVRGDLEGKQAKSDEHMAAISAIDKLLRELPQVDQTAIRELEDLDRRLQIGRGRLAAVATRLEVIRAGDTVAIDGRPLPPGTEQTLTDAADLCVGAGTTIRVTPGGGQPLAELQVEIAGLDAELGLRLAELGVGSVASAREALESRLAAEADRGRHLAKIDALGEDVEGRLRDVRAEIEKLDSEIARKTPVGFDLPADAAGLDAALERADLARRLALEEVEKAEAACAQTAGEAESARQAREAAEAEFASQSVELRELEVKKAALERIHGTDRHAELGRRAARKKQAADAVQETERALAALSPEVTRDDSSRFERTVNLSREQIVEADRRKAAAQALLGRTGTTDLPGAKAAAEARLDAVSRHHAEILRRAEGIRRLRDLFDARRQSVAQLVAAPLQNKVQEYLDALFGSGSRVSVTKSGKAFVDLSVARPAVAGMHFTFDALSGGTKEQVAAACRLAMAELLAGAREGADSAGCNCLPMIFDDAFVNSDPERIKAVQRVLELGARRGLQIIVLSSNPEEYRYLGTPPFTMPDVKRRSTAVGTAAGEAAGAGRDDPDGPDDVPPAIASPEADEGRVPEGSDEVLAERFLAVLGGMDDRKAGNVALRAVLRWDEATYERIKSRLVDAGRVEKGKGRGGSVRIRDAGDGPG